MMSRSVRQPSHRSTLRLLSALTAMTLVASACGGGGGDGTTGPGTPVTPVDVTPVATTAVTIKNTSFTPQAITVSPGATVTFSNQDGIAHNVTFSSASIQGVGDFTAGSGSVTMPTTAGSYPYHCSIHAGMTGSVTVQ